MPDRGVEPNCAVQKPEWREVRRSARMRRAGRTAEREPLLGCAGSDERGVRRTRLDEDVEIDVWEIPPTVTVEYAGWK